MSTPKATPAYSRDMASDTPPLRQTSIQGHVVRMASVTMSFSDLEALTEIVNTAMRASMLSAGTQEAVAREFIATVDSLT
jgi:hypothetical protein